MIVFAVLAKSVAQRVCAKITQAKIAQEVQQTPMDDSETREISIRAVVGETGAIYVGQSDKRQLCRRPSSSRSRIR
jgi:hypothetical protein